MTRTRSSTRSRRWSATTPPRTRRCSRGSSARAPAGRCRRGPRARPAGRHRRGAGLGPAGRAHPPRLHTHDRYGNRIDEVEYIPAYHQLMETAVGHGLHAAPWADDRPGAHVARAAKFMVWNVDAGHGCPISMTYAVVPALRANPELAAQFEPLLTTASYDPGLRDPATKRGLIAGMSMTEKQGGSDVRANTTPRAPARADGTYPLTGHKWFTSAPMSRHVPGPRAGAGRAVLLPGAAGAARRRAQRDAADAAQGQARQQVQRLVGDRVRRRGRLARRRGGPRRADHRRDGQHDPARLRDRHRRRHAHRDGPWPPTTPAHRQRLRQDADRPAR